VQGCAFRTRCAFARPECAATVAPRHGPDAHMWRCVLPPETLDRAA